MYELLLTLTIIIFLSNGSYFYRPSNVVDNLPYPEFLENLCLAIEGTKCKWRSGLIEDIEKHQLSKYATLVKRNNKELIFNLKNGKTFSFKNKEASYETDIDVVNYYYLEYYPEIEAFIIEAHYYEGFPHYTLLSQRTGKTTEICAEPIISPDRMRFICSFYSEVYKSRIQIWNIANLEPKKEFESSQYLTAINPHWNTNTTITFQQYIPLKRTSKYEIAGVREFKFSNNTWELTNP